MIDQTNWKDAIQLTRDTYLEKNVLMYLKKSSKNERVVDLPCYIDKEIVNKTMTNSKIDKNSEIKHH